MFYGNIQPTWLASKILLVWLVVHAYYKELLAEDRTSFITNETITGVTTIEEKSITVTTEEVETAVEKLKIGKAVGPGNILAELLKNTHQKL